MSKILNLNKIKTYVNRRYKANEVFLSFNGGKDCTVVLHLAAAFVQLRKLKAPLCLYVTGDAFPEVCPATAYF